VPAENLTRDEARERASVVRTRSYEIALADAERRAAQSRGEATSLRAETGRLAQLELSARNELLVTDKQVAKLRTELQWAQSQTGNATQEHASLIQRVRGAAEELVAARTAAELKDAEMALGEDPSEANYGWLRDVKARFAEADGLEALIEGFGASSGRI